MGYWHPPWVSYLTACRIPDSLYPIQILCGDGCCCLACSSTWRAVSWHWTENGDLNLRQGGSIPCWLPSNQTYRFHLLANTWPSFWRHLCTYLLIHVWHIADKAELRLKMLSVVQTRWIRKDNATIIIMQLTVIACQMSLLLYEWIRHAYYYIR